MTSTDGGDRGGLLAGIRPLEPGDPQRIGPFMLLGRLGSGGMGRVFLARSAGGRTVAVKVVHEEHASNAQFRARFRREIESARRVGERYTAPVLDADAEASPPWVATGYVPGPSLEQVVREYGPLPVDSVHALADGLLRALKDIHAAGIVHRDLKPSNVMLTVAGPRVIDFGIARALDVSVESLLTSTGMVIGSPGFMSPEQILGQQVGTATDVFALGCVLMYASCGRLPFGGRGGVNQHAVMYQIVEAEPDLSAVPDEPLRALISRCLGKDPAQRPGVAELLAEAERMRPATEGGWLPGPLVAELAQQAALLLDAEVAPLRAEAPDAQAAADSSESAAPGASEPGADSSKARPGASESAPKTPGAEAGAPDRATLDLRPKGASEGEPGKGAVSEPTAPKEPGEEPAPKPTEPDEPGKEAAPEPSAPKEPGKKSAPKSPERAPRSERRRRPMIIGVVVVGVVTVGGGAVTLLPHIGSPEAAPGSSSSATPLAPEASASPSRTAPHSPAAKKPGQADREKDKEQDQGKDTGGTAGADSGGAASGSRGGDTDSSHGTKPGDSSGGGDPGPSGGGDGPIKRPTSSGTRVPASFAGTWKLTGTYYSQQPDKVVISQVNTGEHAVRLISDVVGHCEMVARLESVARDGSRIDIGTAYVDQARSTGICANADPSYFALDEPAGIRHDVGPAHGKGYHYERSD
ncbi:serine/threonine-protein kinase [Streptomyces palmae]|uniref:non-specific serine/threonine protein kinase n=1 Tax=Streptomyces palmae TaxID=1701085 RepID=A0A4Z0H9R4_9ACTN|nr:serine/threonine-protein kinase [Streptomyces palmae]TGB09653.1 serine/threonine protein kinase [Streptomyces palmae]